MSSVPKTDNLQTIDAVYRTAGGLRSLVEIDAGRPLQFVHDVAPAAERLGSVFIMDERPLETLGGGVEVFGSIGPEDLYSADLTAFQVAGRTINNSWWWLLDAMGWIEVAGAGDLEAATVTVSAALTPRDNGRSAPMLVKYWNDHRALETTSGSPHYPLARASQDFWDDFAGLPRRFSAINFMAQDDNTATAVDVLFRFYIVATPIGVFPPPIAFR
jgi:hypothetical protein